MDQKKLDPAVWGPPFWFFLHTVAHTYPEIPNVVTKRKYYDLIQNLPLFLPDAEIGGHFSKLLDLYPVSPYLDSRDSFLRWMHFIHNKVNVKLGHDEISLYAGLDAYFEKYRPRIVQVAENWHLREHYVVGGLIAMAIASIVVLRRYE